MAQRLEAGQKLTSSGLFPPPGVNIIRWDVTPDGWGILLAESDDAAAINQALNLWRAAVPGFFTVTRTAPAQPVQVSLPQLGQLLQTMAG